MDNFEKQERKREARRRLAAQRGRAGRLRGRVVAGSLICFAMLWGIVFGQMVSGNDPVLASKAKAAARRESPAGGAAKEAIETTEPEEVESQLAEPEAEEVEAPIEAEAEFAPEPEVEPEIEFEAEPEPEPELEPLTTGQS